MNTVEDILIQDTRKALIKTVKTLKGKGDIDEVFAGWLLSDLNLDLEIESIARESADRSGGARSYSDIAILGYSADAGLIESSVISALKDGLDWLSGRSITVHGISTGLNQDPIALLGIALGTRIVADTDLTDLVSDWFSNFINEAYEMRGIEDWQKCLIVAAGNILEVDTQILIPETDIINDVLIALTTKNVILPDYRTNKEISALFYLKNAKSIEVEPVRAALSLRACNLIMNRETGVSTITGHNFMNETSKKIKILFLAASPAKEAHLQLDVEFREIDEKLKKSKYRDAFDLKSQWAVRIGDISAYLMDQTPNIVHFSGHGSSAHEIILLNNNNESHPVSAEKLGELFSILKDNIRCVILNACYSDGQAQAIAKHIDCVIGMSDAIGDDSAIVFASHFYQALAFGKSVQDAYKLACLQIDMENLNESSTPKLLTNGKNADQIYLVGK